MRPNPTTIQNLLFEAFKAGFMASGEGYNGEYQHPRTDLNETIRRDFDLWKDQLLAKALGS